MEKLDHLLIKLVFIHIVFLFLAQWAIQHETWHERFNKSVYYEGVLKENKTNLLETLDR
ncbi:DUF5359 family protein [Fictibacillus sp. Mic-4]|uniref:DUF5359 family protein n=1 Tax=Fictibacillus TaxID=1329200 RepID=UPI000415BF52|nr:DUF5359 family protein [Fictibacillus gelatini]